MANRKTALQELEEVELALSRVALGGQSYQIGSRKLTRADYSALVERKKELVAEIAADEDSGLIDDTFVAVFQGR